MDGCPFSPWPSKRDGLGRNFWSLQNIDYYELHKGPSIFLCIKLSLVVNKWRVAICRTKEVLFWPQRWTSATGNLDAKKMIFDFNIKNNPSTYHKIWRRTKRVIGGNILLFFSFLSDKQKKIVRVLKTTWPKETTGRNSFAIIYAFLSFSRWPGKNQLKNAPIYLTTYESYGVISFQLSPLGTQLLLTWSGLHVKCSTWFTFPKYSRLRLFSRLKIFPDCH